MSYDIKRRLLLWLTIVSVIAIIILWALYVNWTIGSPLYGEPAAATTEDIFKTGLSAIGATIEKGVVNAYVYFHNALAESNIFIIQK